MALNRVFFLFPACWAGRAHDVVFLQTHRIFFGTAQFGKGIKAAVLRSLRERENSVLVFTGWHGRSHCLSTFKALDAVVTDVGSAMLVACGINFITIYCGSETETRVLRQ